MAPRTASLLLLPACLLIVGGCTGSDDGAPAGGENRGDAGNSDGDPPLTAPMPPVSDAGAGSDIPAAGESDSAPASPASPSLGPPEQLPPTLPPYPETVFPGGNPHSDAKALLGKTLFWDEQLSSDDSTACGSCHQPAAGGSDPRATDARHPGADGILATDDDPHGGTGLPRCRVGANGTRAPVTDGPFGTDAQVGRRKPPSNLDAMHAPWLFVDGRAKGVFTDPLDPGTVLLEAGAALESQAIGPILDASEMACEGRTWQHVTDKLAGVTPLGLASELPPVLADAIAGADYPDLFERAFGTREITPARISMAIATYERGLVGDQTPYDREARSEPGGLSDAQLRGYGLFVAKLGCVNCHRPPLFTDHTFHDLGFAADPWDTGLAEQTDNAAHVGRFRTPSLRNVALREISGLLHDGLGGDMDTLIATYERPPHLSPNTSVWIRPLELAPDERVDLLDFLRNGLTDPRVADEQPPFDRPTLASEVR